MARAGAPMAQRTYGAGWRSCRTYGSVQAAHLWPGGSRHIERGGFGAQFPSESHLNYHGSYTLHSAP